MLNLNIIEWRSWDGAWGRGASCTEHWSCFLTDLIGLGLLTPSRCSSSFQMQRECIPPGGLEVPLNLRFCSFIPWTLLIFLIPQIHQSPEVPFYYKWFLDLHPNNFLLLVENSISHWALSIQVSNFPSLLKLQKRVRSPFQISRKTLWHPSMSFVSWGQYT